MRICKHEVRVIGSKSDQTWSERLVGQNYGTAYRLDPSSLLVGNSDQFLMDIYILFVSLFFAGFDFSDIFHSKSFLIT
jgi:hypothetical protein